ncbi:MAG TPA: SCO family protein [Pyrinomonadaceae bacterium]|jgi:protein SCO1/2|nr:SCO family protein [Pyrinomonadaceae bacterium]
MISQDKKTGARTAALVVFALLCCAAVEARATPRQTPQPAKGAAAAGGADHCHQPPAAAEAPPKGNAAAAKPSIPDVAVTDQNGRKSRFYTDLVKGKLVIINFVFTSCTNVCPMQGANFAKLQAALGDRLGRDISLISVSTDPLVDTPERLKAWGARFGAKPGWTLVTGERDEMDKLLRSLTGGEARRGEHSPVALLGDFERGAWVRAYGLSEPERYLQLFANLNATPAAQPPAGRN